MRGLRLRAEKAARIVSSKVREDAECGFAGVSQVLHDPAAQSAFVSAAADPLFGMRKPGSVSMFWVFDACDSDSNVESGPSTADLVRTAAVHGFSVNEMAAVDRNLGSPWFETKVVRSESPESGDILVRRARDLLKALVGEHHRVSEIRDHNG